MELASVEVPDDLRGRPARSLLRPEDSRTRLSEYTAANTKTLRVLVDKHPDFDIEPFERELRALREGDAKFIWSSDGRHELYDLARDPGENDDRAAGDPVEARQMQERLEDFLARLGGMERARDEAPMPSREHQEMLESLGYGVSGDSETHDR